jgi:hypothetical protein
VNNPKPRLLHSAHNPETITSAAAMQWQLGKTWRKVAMTSPTSQSLMPVELLQDERLGALVSLGGSAGNGKLREWLGWDEPTYESVRASMVANGRRQPGRCVRVSCTREAA